MSGWDQVKKDRRLGIHQKFKGLNFRIRPLRCRFAQSSLQYVQLNKTLDLRNTTILGGSDSGKLVNEHYSWLVNAQSVPVGGQDGLGRVVAGYA